MTAQGPGSRSGRQVTGQPVSAHLLVGISSTIMPVMTRSKTRAALAMAQQAPAQAVPAPVPAAAGALRLSLDPDRNKS